MKLTIALLVVCAMVAIGVAVPFVQHYQENQEQLCRHKSSVNLKLLNDALHRFRDTHNDWPSRLEEIVPILGSQAEFDEAARNPVTSDNPGYAYAKPPALVEREDNFITLFQLRRGQRDLSLDVAFVGATVGPYTPPLESARQIKAALEPTSGEAIEGRWRVVHCWPAEKAQTKVGDELDFAGPEFRGALLGRKNLDECVYRLSRLNDGATIKWLQRQSVVNDPVVIARGLHRLEPGRLRLRITSEATPGPIPADPFQPVAGDGWEVLELERLTHGS